MMVLCTKLLNLVGILIVATCVPYIVAVSEETDDDISLKQALFLVDLLKSDFVKILRGNGNLKDNGITNYTEDANTTCPLPLDDFNSTTTETVATENARVATASPAVDAMTTTLPRNLSEAPVLQVTTRLPMPYTPNFLPPNGLSRRGNFPDDYKFPYRFNRRQMPDYYYDSPLKRPGNFRRNNYAAGDFDNMTENTPAEPKTPSEATAVNVEETTTSDILSTIKQSSNQSTSQPSTQLASQTSTTTTSSTTIKQSKTVKPPPPTIRQSATFRSKVWKRLRVKIPTPFAGAKATSSFRKKEVKVKNTSRHHLRELERTIAKNQSEDVEISQVASELMKELHGANIENQVAGSPINLKKTYKTTMKIFLKGSSRLPVPLPENNGFCHSHPHNSLCAML